MHSAGSFFYIKQQWSREAYKAAMFNSMQIKITSISLSAVVLLLGNGFMEWCYPEEDAKKPVEVQTGQKPETVAVPGTIVPDSAGSNKVDAGIDLVVSKVEITRGIFEGEHKIQITPYVKNMWKGSTSARIKILLDGLALAEWIEGGIGPGEEKNGGSLYVRDATGSTALNFSVEVDDGNEVPENNEHNNRCENLTFGASQTRETVDCPIVGPHGPSQ
jgi:hypothetical protein